MAQDTTFIATLHGATREVNSPNGNPMWTLHTSQGDFKTGEDSQIGYEVKTLAGEGRDSLVGKDVVFHATGRRVWDIRKA